MRRALLYARSGSSLLTGVLLDAIRGAWLDAAGVELSSLTPEQRMDCDIIFGGIVAAMADRELEMGPETIPGVLSRPLGQGIAQTLRELGGR
jgi:hypothetical protein